MLILMLVSLYTSRVILSALGVEDFGINNVVAGFVTVLAFFTSSLSNASQRYLSLGLGKGSIEDTTTYFRQSNTLMLAFSAVVLLLGETVGLWFVSSQLVIPPERLTAAIWVYQFAIISTLCSIVQVTYVADIIAQEKMGIYAYLGIFEAVARLAIAFMIQWFTSVDHLILFGLLTAVVSCITFAFHVIYCKSKFKEISFALMWNKKLLKDMGKFISTNLFGCFAWSASAQGINILLNLFFGPAVNAARGIAVQVESAVARFAENVMTAMKPQIIKSYAVNDYDGMKSLVIRSTKYMTMIALLLAIPLVFEAEFVLNLWLGQVPDYTVAFVRIVLINMLIQQLGSPLWIAANATGKIVKNQLYGRLFTLLALPVSGLFLMLEAEPVIPMIVFAACNVAYWLYCLYDIHNQIGLSITQYFSKTIVPSVILGSVISTGCFAIYEFVPVCDFVKFIYTCLAALLLFVLTGYFILDRSEKEFLVRLVNKSKRK